MRKNSRAKSVPMYKKKAKKTYGQLGPEMKFLDTDQLNQTASATGQVYSMNTLAQGTTNITRIGNKIQIKSVMVKAVFESATGAVSASQNVGYWMIVLDKEPEAAAIASYNQIMSSNDIIAMRNIGESDRFVVLAKGSYAHPYTAASVTQATGTEVFVEKFVKCDIAAKYTLTTATQSAFGSNQLLFTWISQNSDTNKLMDLRTRIRFTDE